MKATHAESAPASLSRSIDAKPTATALEWLGGCARLARPLRTCRLFAIDRLGRCLAVEDVMQTKTRSALFLFAVAAAVASPLSAEAQRLPSPPLEIPFAPPDLEVAVTSPPFIGTGGLAWVDVNVSNTLTTVRSTRFGGILGGSAVNDVDVTVYFGGLRVILVETAGGFQCPLPAGGLVTQVTCTQGAIPAGGNVTIRALVTLSVADPYYCGLVSITALVDPFAKIAERSETNNNPPPTTIQVACIN